MKKLLALLEWVDVERVGVGEAAAVAVVLVFAPPSLTKRSIP